MKSYLYKWLKPPQDKLNQKEPNEKYMNNLFINQLRPSPVRLLVSSQHFDEAACRWNPCFLFSNQTYSFKCVCLERCGYCVPGRFALETVRLWKDGPVLQLPSFMRREMWYVSHRYWRGLNWWSHYHICLFSILMRSNIVLQSRHCLQCIRLLW